MPADRPPILFGDALRAETAQVVRYMTRQLDPKAPVGSVEDNVRLLGDYMAGAFGEWQPIDPDDLTAGDRVALGVSGLVVPDGWTPPTFPGARVQWVRWSPPLTKREQAAAAVAAATGADLDLIRTALEEYL